MDALTIAKEITLALIPTLPISSMDDHKLVGKCVAEVFEIVLKGVVKAIDEL